MRNKTKLILIILVVLLLSITITIIAIIADKYNYKKLISKLENEGYSFSNLGSKDINTYECVLSNNKNIMIERVVEGDSYYITFVQFDDMDNIEEFSEMKYYIYPSKKYVTTSHKEQYYLYQSWLKKENITEKQLKGLLNYYYSNSEVTEL